MQFVTVEPQNDDEVMVKAFEPYIVYPPYTKTRSAEYTVDRFYTTKGENNSEWLGTNYQPSSVESNRLTRPSRKTTTTSRWYRSTERN